MSALLSLSYLYVHNIIIITLYRISHFPFYLACNFFGLGGEVCATYFQNGTPSNKPHTAFDNIIILHYYGKPHFKNKKIDRHAWLHILL